MALTYKGRCSHCAPKGSRVPLCPESIIQTFLLNESSNLRKEENNELSKVLGNQTSEFKTFEKCIDSLEGLVALNKSLLRDSKEIQSQDIGSSVESLVSDSLAVGGYELIKNIIEGNDIKNKVFSINPGRSFKSLIFC